MIKPSIEPAHQDLYGRVYQLIWLRWLFVAALLIAVFVANAFLANTLPLVPLVSATLAVAGYNILLYIYVRKLGDHDPALRHQRL